MNVDSMGFSIFKYVRALCSFSPTLRRNWLTGTMLCYIHVLEYSQSPTGLDKGNTQLKSTLAILSHLKGRKKLRNTSKVHSPEV